MSKGHINAPGKANSLVYDHLLIKKYKNMYSDNVNDNDNEKKYYLPYI